MTLHGNGRVNEHLEHRLVRAAAATGTQFTCFTSTKVQILTPALVRAAAATAHMALWCLDDSVLTLLALLVQKHKY